MGMARRSGDGRVEMLLVFPAAYQPQAPPRNGGLVGEPGSSAQALLTSFLVVGNEGVRKVIE